MMPCACAYPSPARSCRTMRSARAGSSRPPASVSRSVLPVTKSITRYGVPSTPKSMTETQFGCCRRLMARASFSKRVEERLLRRDPRVQELHGHGAPELQALAAVHDAHGARRELRVEAVPALQHGADARVRRFGGRSCPRPSRLPPAPRRHAAQTPRAGAAPTCRSGTSTRRPSARGRSGGSR